MDFKISCLSVCIFLWSVLLIWTADSGYTFMDAVSLHRSLIFVSVLWWIFNIRNRFYNYLWYILLRDMILTASLYFLLRIRSFLQEIQFPSLLYWSKNLCSHWTHPAFPRSFLSSFSCNIYIYYELNECLCFR